MTLTAELPLALAAVALALLAVVRVLPWRDGPLSLAIAAIAGVAGPVAPLAAYPFVPIAGLAGRALWQWSSVGGPTIEASYRLDGLGALGVALVTAYSAASLIAATRTERSPILVPLILGNGLAAIALAVTDDLIATTVLLGVLAAVTAAAVLIVAPPPAAARVAAYLAVGLQAFLVAALLVSRFGGASFRFGDMRPTAISPGIVLAATIGAALFAGLYPFVPWRYRARPEASERETLRGLVAMPAGIAGSLVLLRLIGVTRVDLTTLGLPAVDGAVRLALALVAVVAVLAVVLRRRVVPGRSIVVGATTVLVAATYPSLHWSELVVTIALLTVAYAAAVSWSLTDEWDVTRYDVVLATLWVGLALGTPVSLAAALLTVLADAGVALAEAFWLPPHRTYLVLVTGAVATVAGLTTMAVGALAAGDGTSIALALVTIGCILALQIAHLARRARVALAPVALDGTAAAVACLATILVGTVAGPAVYAAVGVTVGRPFPTDSGSATTALLIIGASVLVVALARSVRLALPNSRRADETLHLAVQLADPVPAGTVAFGALDWTATRLTFLLSFFERRAGVGLAAALIVALLVWSIR